MLNPHYNRFLNNGQQQQSSNYSTSGNPSMSMPGNPRQRGGEMVDSGRVLGGAARMPQSLNPQSNPMAPGGPNSNGSTPKFENRPSQRYILYVSRLQNNYYEPKSENLLRNLGTLAKEFLYVCVQDIPKNARPPGLKMTPAILDTLRNELFQGTNAINFVSQLKHSEIQPAPVNVGTTFCKFGYNCFPMTKEFAPIGAMGGGMGPMGGGGGTLADCGPTACGNFNGGLGFGMDTFQSKVDGNTDVRYNDKSGRHITSEDAATYSQFRNDLGSRYEQQRKTTTQPGAAPSLPSDLRAIHDNIRNRNQ